MWNVTFFCARLGNSFTPSLNPAFSPRRRRIGLRLLENSCDWIGRPVIRKIGSSQQLFPLPSVFAVLRRDRAGAKGEGGGERTKGEGGRKIQTNPGGLLDFPSVPAGLCRHCFYAFTGRLRLLQVRCLREPTKK